MASAIWEGLARAKLMTAAQVSFSESHEQTRRQIQDTFGLTPSPLESLIQKSDILLICIKPQGLPDFLSQFPGHLWTSEKLLISILAGIPTQTFQDALGSESQILRVMPNTPALVGEGMSALAFNAYVSDAYKAMALDLFECLGKTETVPESMMDVVTGISGSGPAFMYRIADNIAKLGEQEGLKYETALTLAAQTLVGAGKMLLESGKSPSELIQDVSSPNGTTVAGLEMFDKTQIGQEIQRVVLNAINRSRELSNEIEGKS